MSGITVGIYDVIKILCFVQGIFISGKISGGSGKASVILGKVRVISRKASVIPGKASVIPGKVRVISRKASVIPGKISGISGKASVIPGKVRVIPGRKTSRNVLDENIRFCGFLSKKHLASLHNSMDWIKKSFFGAEMSKVF